jgi:DNA-binding MarR family transcriptional regulator
MGIWTVRMADRICLRFILFCQLTILVNCTIISDDIKINLKLCQTEINSLKTTMASIHLNSFLSYQLDLVCESAVKMASRVYEREVNLSFREVRVLRTVGSFPGIAHRELVERVLFEKSLVSRLVTGLVKKSYLKREIDLTDARRVPLSLTNEGAAILRKADEIGMAMNETWLSTLTPEEMRSLDLCIEKLSGALTELEVSV